METVHSSFSLFSPLTGSGGTFGLDSKVGRVSLKFDPERVDTEDEDYGLNPRSSFSSFSSSLLFLVLLLSLLDQREIMK